MKIAHIVCVYPPYAGGMGNSACQIARELSAQGSKITVFTPLTGSAKSEQRDRPDSPSIKRLKPLLSYGHGAFLPQLAWRLKGFDLVHLHYPFFGAVEIIYFLKIVKKKKLPLVIHYHMDTADLGLAAKIISWPLVLCRSRIFRLAEAVTCASLDYLVASPIRGIYEENKKKFFEVPFGVDTEKFFFREKSPSHRFKLLFVGGLDRAHYFKGLSLLIEAMGELRDKPIDLAIVGDGDLRREYEVLAEKHNLRERIKFHGKLPDKDLVHSYQEADAFIFPSLNRHEAFGLVLLEAMSCGTPVIASDLPGVRSVFRDGEQGFYFKTGQKMDLIDKINLLCGSSGLGPAMGRKGRELVLKRYLWPNAAAQLMVIYRNVLSL